MKKISLLILFLASIGGFSAQISNGLVVHYRCDGNGQDSSPNEIDATAAGTSTITDNFGNANGALQFSGSNAYLQVPHNSLLKPSFPITVAFWIKMDSPEFSIVFKSDRAPNNYYGYWIAVLSDLKVITNIGDGGVTGVSGRRSKTANTPLTLGNWHHVTCVFTDGDDMDIYIDCANAGGTYTGTGTGNVLYSTGDSYFFHESISSATEFYEGKINDFAIWNRELNLNEINSLCNNALDISELNQEINSTITISPNPTADLVTITSDNQIINSVEMIDVNGNLVKKIEANSTIVEYQLNDIESGVYFFNVLLQCGQKEIRKIIKE